MKNTSTRDRLLASSILAGLTLALAAASAPAYAQSAPPTDPNAPPPLPVRAQAAPQAAPGENVVVTGSRIRRTDFTSSAPIQVITAEQSTLEGLTDTAQILQQSSIAESANQINNFFTGFLVGGGAGVNTLSLRGLGAQRTLILLNGRRMGPAGIGGTVAPVDLNTIPSSIIDHTEILKDGASSIYGSDAIAGVVNIITKANPDGGNINASVNPAQRHGGEQWDLSGSWGKTFNRGYISFGGEVFRQEALHLGDRDYLNCSQDLAKDPVTGKSIDFIDPKTGASVCQNLFTNAIENASNGRIYVSDPKALLGQNNGTSLNGFQRVAYTLHQAGTFSCTAGGLTGTFTYLPGDPRLVGNTAPCAVQGGVLVATGSDNLPLDVAGTTNAFLALRQDNPALLRQTAISPSRRLSFYSSGAYDLDAHTQLYGEVLANRRTSSQTGFGQFFPIVSPGNVFNPFNAASASYIGGPAGFAEPVLIRNASAAQKVDYARIVAGVRGDFPTLFGLKGWNYDLYGQYSQSKATYGQNFIYNDRVNATAGSQNAAGCDPNVIATSGSGQTLAQHEGANAACVPINYFSGSAVAFGSFGAAGDAYLNGYAVGHTTYDHMYVEGSISGDLITLPAGPVGAALGFQIRHEKLNDVPDKEAQASNFWGFSTAGITAGSDDIREAFAEFRIPVLKAVPLADRLTVSVSGRYSDYKSFGSTMTGAVGVDWQIVDWFRARATHNTGFRAPALTELFLGNLVGFAGQTAIDPCINYGLSSNTTLQKNCASQGIAPNYTGFSPNVGSSASATVTSGGGLINHLKPETSRSDTIGLVLTPRLFGLDFSLATDWYHTKVLNQVQQFGAPSILTSCYTSANFPTDPFCALFKRNLDPNSSTFQNILTVQNNFVNVASQVDEGLDVTARFRHKLPHGVNFSLDSQLSWTFFQKTVLINGLTTNTLGGTRFPPFVGNVNFRFDKGPWTLNWFINMVGHTSDDNFNLLGGANPALQTTTPCAGTTNGQVCGGFHGVGIPAYRNYVLPFAAISSVSIRRRFEDFTFTFGVKNLFDHTPDPYSVGGNGRIGDTRLRSQEDLVGRSVFMSIDKRF